MGAARKMTTHIQRFGRPWRAVQRSILFVAFGLASSLMFPGSADAGGTNSGAVTFRTEILSSCEISVTSLAFPTYDGSTDITATAVASVACGSIGQIVLSIDGVAYGPNRNLLGLTNATGDLLLYELALDPTMSIRVHREVLDSAGTNDFPFMVDVNAQAMPIDITFYARIPAGQIPVGGAYAGSLVFTLWY